MWQDLGAVADPSELVKALHVIGLLQRGFTPAEHLCRFNG
ncbi:rRNA processing protein Krr1/Pno1 [Streptosporangium album]|uniref:rRNA processing protein Krr1/Pno1 n=1 Tax=Streptosporangium album TaxID=47479 RepID=A0A7W7S5C9_9ACTN|nr:rRNA processing protein Krr1/Pno1 [Streptosporangium album]